jgi:leucyl/phenylalanyl-tRNA--protein transferase
MGQEKQLLAFVFLSMHFLTDELYFPPAETADRHGIVAIGGDLRPERLTLAYSSGIFPWFGDGEPILWWAPPKRMVLFFDELKISKSMRNVINRKLFHVTFNEHFDAVIENCRKTPREEQEGTWITKEMLIAYRQLHEMGFAKSVEVWQGETLVGGLYGVDLGHMFSGESMFSHVSNASKFGFIALAAKLQSEGYKLLDCQIYNDHLASLGAREIPRKDFMAILNAGKTT